jgi:hypothetical protein
VLDGGGNAAGSQRGGAADGTVTTEPITIRGPDLREEADGKALGLAKIIAGLVGVGTDEIVRRAERAWQRWLRNWIAGLLAVVVAHSHVGDAEQ